MSAEVCVRLNMKMLEEGLKRLREEKEASFIQVRSPDNDFVYILEYEFDDDITLEIRST